jgi:tetratricopeptide (TPR) repeat protein
LSLGWYPIARTHLKALLGRREPPGGGEARTTAPEDGEQEYLLGACEEGLRDLPAAALWYGHAIAHAPGHIDGYVRLAILLRNSLNRPGEADRVMDRLVAVDGATSRAHLERALYRRIYRIEGADRDVVRALELAPEDPDVLRTAAACAVDRGDFERARRHLTVAVELHPRNWSIAAELAGLERRAGHSEQAEAWLRRGIDAATDPEGRGQLLYILAKVLVDQARSTEAREVLERLEQAGVRPVLLRYLAARIGVAEERWSEAARGLEAIFPLLEAEPDLAYQANLLLGRCYEQLGDGDQRYFCLRRAVSLAPQRWEGRLGLAAAIEALGKFDEAIAEYRRVIDRAPGAGLALARLLILRNLRRPAAGRDWPGVEQVLDQAARALPGSPAVTIWRAEALVGQGRPQWAWTLLMKARDEQPDRVELWTALAELADRHETPQAALSILQEAEDRLGPRVGLFLARIQHWASRGGPEPSRELADLERRLASLPAGDREPVRRGLSDAYLRIGASDAAGRILGQLVRQRPQDLGLRLSQFTLALQVDDETAMGQVLDEIRALEDDPRTPEVTEGSLWRWARARTLLATARRRGRAAIGPEVLDEARVHLAEAARRRPSWPLVPLCLAELEDFAGDPGRALPHFLAAIESGLSGAAIIRQAVQQLFDLGRFEQADDLIRKMQERGLGPGDAQFQRLTAEVSLRVNDPARALELARKAVPADSKDYRDPLWLGQISWAAGDRVQAEAELRRAVALGGGEPETWVTLVRFLGRMGRGDDAKVVIEQVRHRLGAEQAAPVLARCYAELGEGDRALEQFRVALATRPDDVATLRGAATVALAVGQIGEAETHLVALVALAGKAADDATWARRILATVWASGGDSRQSIRALELLGLVDEGASYLPAADEPVEELRAKARVLAARNNRVARRAAIRTLRHLAERGLPTPDDSLLLAQLYEADGDWPLAHRQIQHLLAGAGMNPRYLAAAARSLLRRGLIDEAQPLLETLEQSAPRSLATIELKARALHHGGRSVEAVALLRSFADGEPDQAGGAAALLEELGAVPAAEDLYRRLASRPGQPRAPLTLAAFLGRRERLAEALDLCERAWSSCPPEDVAATTVQVLASAPVDPEQARRAVAALGRAVTKAPRNAALLFHLANIRCLEGQYAEAEALYRRAQACDPETSGPLANLAWLLARRDGRGTEALGLIARAMKLDGPAPDLLDTRAAIELVLGRGDPAIIDLEDAVAVGPSALKHVHLAQAYLMAGRRNDAGAAVRKARAAGLRVERLTPLERGGCERLLEELARR